MCFWEVGERLSSLSRISSSLRGMTPNEEGVLHPAFAPLQGERSGAEPLGARNASCPFSFSPDQRSSYNEGEKTATG